MLKANIFYMLKILKNYIEGEKKKKKLYAMVNLSLIKTVLLNYSNISLKQVLHTTSEALPINSKSILDFLLSLKILMFFCFFLLAFGISITIRLTTGTAN